MTTFSDTIIAAARAADAVVASTGGKPPPVDPHAVEAMLRTVPDRAAQGRRADPTADAFLLAEWNPRDGNATRLGLAVRDRLVEHGLDVDVAEVPVAGRLVPTALYVTYESLAVVASVLASARETWLRTATELWAARFGSAGEVALQCGPYGDVVAFLGPTPSGVPDIWDDPRARLERPVYRSGTGWPEEDPAAVVETALLEFRIPRWTPEAVEAAWAAAVPGGRVVRSRNQWLPDDVVRQGRTLIFVRGETERTYHVDDVFGLTADELVAKVLAEGGAAWGDTPIPPAEEPAGEDAPHAVEELADRRPPHAPNQHHPHRGRHPQAPKGVR
jgi:hypothetical protein